jgi:hypothetical protein
MKLKKLPPTMDAAARERQAAEIAAADAERRRLLGEQLHEMWLESVKAASYGGPDGYDDGGGTVMAALEAIEPGWRWHEDRIVGHDECDDLVYDWERWRLSSPWLSPEEKAARDRATEEELLAYERTLYGPFWYVERNDPGMRAVAKVKAQAGNAGASKSGDAAVKKRVRKSRKKPVFWSPKKVD